jgi:hypothetical protein
MNSPEPTPAGRVDRRTAIKWVLTVAASTRIWDSLSHAAKPLPTPAGRVSGGYGPDPDILRLYQPGDLWPLIMTAEERATTHALCDMVIPADSGGPAASTVGVPAFIDEWISAPYPGHEVDRRIVTEGLAFVDSEAQSRHSRTFIDLSTDEKTEICESLCRTRGLDDRLRKGSQFFKRFRDLTAGGYYTTPEGMKDIGYVGNRPMPAFDGPPPEVLRKIGLA